MEASHFSCDLRGRSHSHSHSTGKLRTTFWSCRVPAAGGRELIGDGCVWQWPGEAAMPEWEMPASRKKHLPLTFPGV